jgi:hypothetical protein
MRDRTSLACAGLALLAAGGASLACGLGGFGPEPAARTLLGASPWLRPSAAVIGCAVAGLGLAWLAAQVRRRTLRRIAMGDEHAGATRMAARVAVRAVTADVASYPGVRRARVRLLGSERNPWVRVRVTCDDRSDLTDLRRRIRDDALVRLRLALDRRDIAGMVDFHVGRDA